LVFLAVACKETEQIGNRVSKASAILGPPEKIQNDGRRRRRRRRVLLLKEETARIPEVFINGEHGTQVTTLKRFTSSVQFEHGGTYCPKHGCKKLSQKDT
jgi:hypothetical protein